MIRYTIMSRLGLVEPLVRLQRRIERSNRGTLEQRHTARSLDRAA
jgi:hypothetical protein